MAGSPAHPASPRAVAESLGWHPGWAEDGFWFEEAGEYDSESGAFQPNGYVDCYGPDGCWNKTGFYNEEGQFVVAGAIFLYGRTPLRVSCNSQYPHAAPVLSLGGVWGAILRAI